MNRHLRGEKKPGRGKSRIRVLNAGETNLKYVRIGLKPMWLECNEHREDYMKLGEVDDIRYCGPW